jgi:hypothetical protein
MTVARSVADVLTDHVVFEVECIDRMYLNVYVPQLQYAAGLVGFVHRQLGLPIASTAPMAPISDAFTTAWRRFARDQQVPWVDFVKGQRKDDIMHQHLAAFTGTEGVLFIGRAQEKTSLFRTEKRRDAQGRALSGCLVSSVTRVSWGGGVALIGVVSASCGKADDVVPGGEAGGHFSAVGIGAQSVASGSEVG